MRSLGDADTHRDELGNDDTEAGVVFQPPAVASPYPVPMTPTGSGRAALQVPDPVFPTKLPAGRRSGSCPAPLPAPGGQPDPSGPPVISADAAARVLCDYFLGNAERGDNAANDEFVAELALRIRTEQARSGGASFPRAAETTAVPHRGVR